MCVGFAEFVGAPGRLAGLPLSKRQLSTQHTPPRISTHALVRRFTHITKTPPTGLHFYVVGGTNILISTVVRMARRARPLSL